MKPSAFQYVKARSRDHAVQSLAADPQNSKVLSGGQSLIPMMNLRLARPERLIDISRVPGLDILDDTNSDVMVIGAAVRHVELEHLSSSGALPWLLRTAASHIGHLPIRTRGTFGGSLAHSDSASEWCLVARLLDASMVAESVRGERTIAAEDFFVSLFTTALDPDELLTKILIPKLLGRHVVGFSEYARRAGDFAMVAVGTDLTLSEGKIASARVCIGGVSESPLRSSAAEATLVGQPWPGPSADMELVRETSESAARDAVSAGTSGLDAYQVDLVRALVTRSLTQGSRQLNAVDRGEGASS